MLLLLVVCAIIAILTVQAAFMMWDMLDKKIERLMGMPLGVLIGMGIIGTIMMGPQVTMFILSTIWYRIRTMVENVLGYFRQNKSRA